MAHPTQARALEYYNYDQETGKLFFKERPRSEFKRLCDYAYHINQRVGKEAGTDKHIHRYSKVVIDGSRYTAHRIIWLMQMGEWPQYPEFEIDHIDRDRTNNKMSNLRIVSKTENCRNGSIRSDNTSGVRGVSWCKHKRRWKARIGLGAGKVVELGYFANLAAAAVARSNAELKFWGAGP